MMTMTHDDLTTFFICQKKRKNNGNYETLSRDPRSVAFQMEVENNCVEMQ